MNFDKIRFNEAGRSPIKLNILEQENVQAVATYPNPMVTEATIAVNVPQASDVTVKVFDVFGSEVKLQSSADPQMQVT